MVLFERASVVPFRILPNLRSAGMNSSRTPVTAAEYAMAFHPEIYPSLRANTALLRGMLIISQSMAYKKGIEGVSVCKHYLLIGGGAIIWLVQKSKVF